LPSNHLQAPLAHANDEEVAGRHYPLELEVLLEVAVPLLPCLQEVVHPQQLHPGDGDAISAVVVVVVYRRHQGWPLLLEGVMGLLPQLRKHLLLEEVEKHLPLQEEAGLLLQFLALSS